MKKKHLEFNISTDVSLNFVLHQNESNIRYITFKYFFNIVYLKCSKYKSRRTMTGILKGKSLTVTTQEHTRIALLVLRRNQNFTTKLWYPDVRMDFTSDDKTLHGFTCHLEANFFKCQLESQVIHVSYHHNIIWLFIKYIIQ